MIEWFNNLREVIGWELIAAFAICQLINVILSTIKSVLTVKGTKASATLISTISYTLNAGVISQIGKVDDLPTVCIITALTNLVGVYFGLWVIEKLRKDRLLRISATVKTEHYKELIQELHDKDIDFITYTTEWTKRIPVDVFSKNKKESKVIESIFKKYEVKYTIYSNWGIL